MGKIKRALISVSAKEGIVELSRELTALGVEILSTGGTAKLLQKEGIPVREVSDFTGQPEILDGRLKTLHPKIHGGILARRDNKKHLKELEKSEIETIDLLIVNLYPFEATIQRPNVSLEEAIENIDIGGPTMLRAAAKNWEDVTVVTDPADYDPLLEELKNNDGKISKETNFKLAKKVFTLTARYDGLITNYLTGEKDRKAPEAFNLQGTLIQNLRYGENPHQRAAFYHGRGGAANVTNAKQLHGKELSFNNIIDLDAAIETVKEFEHPACVIIKHTNPCGVAAGKGQELSDVFKSALSCDPQSSFGGIIGLNREVDEETAKEISKAFYECVAAPSFSNKALATLKKKKNIRLMEMGNLERAKNEKTIDIKKVAGGFLIQDVDDKQVKVRDGKVATKRQPTEAEWAALELAWKVAKHVKSNAIVFANKERTLGIGAGQMSRVDSVRIAISKYVGAGHVLPLPKETAMASDAFFPFRDNIDEAAKAGVTAIIQPGGSLRDQESIDAANENKMAMVMTGVRHFKH